MCFSNCHSFYFRETEPTHLLLKEVLKNVLSVEHVAITFASVLFFFIKVILASTWLDV